MKFVVALILATGLATQAAADTLLRLSESARVMVHPDELAATLRTEAVTASAAEAQAQVNTAMARAVGLARQTAGISVTTGYYSVWAQPRDFSHFAGKQDWRASQTLTLRSADSAALLTLVGTLQQQGLAVSQLGWQMAAATARHARAEATKQALGNLRTRAEEAAGILGLRFDSFREVRLDSTRPQPMLRSIASPAPALASASAPPPTAEAEDLPVEASVEADAVLK